MYIDGKPRVAIELDTDSNYVFQTRVTMVSILENKWPDDFYEFFILLSPNVTSEDKAKLQNLEDAYNYSKINLIEMDDTYGIDNAGIIRSKASYYRLYLSEILPDELRVLHLDSDMIVKKSLRELYSIDMPDSCVVAAVNDDLNFIPEKDRKQINCYGENGKKIYVNSGTLLFDLWKLRDRGIDKWLKEAIAWNGRNNMFTLGDQSVLNFVVNHDTKGILHLPLEYNLLLHRTDNEVYEENPYANENFSKEVWLNGINDPAIIHYSSSSFKPWRNLLNERILMACEQEWLKYAVKLPDFEENFERLLSCKQNKYVPEITFDKLKCILDVVKSWQVEAINL
jgi:lipopolysaccharide biosynthesis glycosyltransferase